MEMESKQEEVLTVAEISRRFKVHANTVRLKIHEGLLPAKKLGNKGKWRVPISVAREVFGAI